MGWKNIATWLKGGIITLVIYIVLLIFALILPSGDMGNIMQWILSLLGAPLIIVARSLFSIETGAPLSSFYTPMFIYSFVVGAIIGWIVGKVKSRKELTSQKDL